MSLLELPLDILLLVIDLVGVHLYLYTTIRHKRANFPPGNRQNRLKASFRGLQVSILLGRANTIQVSHYKSGRRTDDA